MQFLYFFYSITGGFLQCACTDIQKNVVGEGKEAAEVSLMILKPRNLDFPCNSGLKSILYVHILHIKITSLKDRVVVKSYSKISPNKQLVSNCDF